MITDNETFKLKTVNGEPMSVEVNWRPTDEDTNECKVLKIAVGDKITYIALGDLRTILFACSDTESQKKMMPVQMITQRRYQTVIGVKAKENIKKGAMVNFKVDIPLPPIEKEIMMEAARQIKKGIIRPI
jgi:hypothetical protein